MENTTKISRKIIYLLVLTGIFSLAFSAWCVYDGLHYRAQAMEEAIPKLRAAQAEGFEAVFEEYLAEELARAQAEEEEAEQKLLARESVWRENMLTNSLVLVNPWNPIPEGYTVRLAEVETFEVDIRCAEALTQMLQDAREAGAYPKLCSAYRTREYQQMLFDNKIERLEDYGYSPEEAPEIASHSVARPDTSEHQLGLSVDIVDEWYTGLTEWQEETWTQQWLMANSWRYGFILRYPNGTSDITGIIYEPWHYRYVGIAAAEEIYNMGVPLEIYLENR